MTLLEDALAPSGGLDRCRQLERFTVYFSIGGALLAHRGRPGVLREIVAEGSIRTQSVRLAGLGDSDRSGRYHPDRVGPARPDAEVVEGRGDPRAALLSLADGAPWDDLHLAGFCGLSVWTLLVAPVLLALPGTRFAELPPCHEQGMVWRRLRAEFPPDSALHSPDQVHYFDPDGLQRRVDYRNAGAAGLAMADFASAHQAFSGVVIPTLHRSVALRSDGSVLAKPALLDMEIFDAAFA